MKVQLRFLIALLFLGCSQERQIAVPEASTEQGGGNAVNEDSDTDGASAGDAEGTSNDGPSPSADEFTEPTTKLPELSEFSGAHAAVATLQNYYSKSTGLWSNDWLGSAHALTALIDYMAASDSQDYKFVLGITYDKNAASNFATDSYEHAAWWGLAWLRAYDLTQEARYLAMAKTIADTLMSSAWDQTCNGGLYLKSDKAAKGAVVNELYIKLTAGLHNRISGDTAYLANSQKALSWLLASGLIKDNLVNATLNSKCENSGDSVWSQNQGILLGALAELYKATSDKSLMTKAKAYALASTKTFAGTDSIIKESNDASCGTCLGDDRLYKGAYARGLSEVNHILQNESIEAVLQASANAAWDKARSTYDLIGFHWQGAFDSDDAMRQASAVALFNTRIPAKTRTNLALNKTASSKTPCASSESVGKLVDGTAETKFCAINDISGADIDVDLGEEKLIQRIRILHAGAGGEKMIWNTDSFEIYLSATGVSGSWVKNIAIAGNKSNATVHELNQTARYVRLHIVNAGSDNVIRLYDMTIE